MQLGLARTQQGHAVLATGDQQSAQLQFAHQLLTLGNQFGLVLAAADDGFELGQVRRNQAGAAVDGEVLALGIGQYRNAALASGLDQRLVVLQRAFAVVGQHQHADLIQQRLDIGGQGDGVSREGFLEVHPQQLLVAAHDTQLDDGRLPGDALETGLHADGVQPVAQAVGGFIGSGHTNQEGRRAQCGKVQRDVGGTARTILMLLDPHHRYRRFRRDTRGRAVPVAIEHYIADYQHGGLIETGHGQLHENSARVEIAADNTIALLSALCRRSPAYYNWRTQNSSCRRAT
ncbi:hypothetical protein D3C81_1232990 [compost metagenome]